jgi:hypothetical protein
VYCQILNTQSRQITHTQIRGKSMKTLVDKHHNSLYHQQLTSLRYRRKKYINPKRKSNHSSFLTSLFVIPIHQRVEHLQRLRPVRIIHHTALYTSVVTACTTIFTLFSFLEKKNVIMLSAPLCVCVCVCVCPQFQLPSHVTDFHETSYDHYKRGRHSNTAVLNFH